MTWITDKNGNRCSIERWGSREAAQAAMDSLTNCSDRSDCYGCYDCYRCSDCSDCSDCYGCSDCSDCYGCSDCSDCSDCYGCYDCSDCYRCSGCYDCYDCYRCSDCSGCSGCYGCSDCSDCYRCSGCSDCSDCSRCSGCSGCSGCYGCYGKIGDAAPTIPVIPNIHAAIYEAVTAKPTALEMGTWHTCETTHCRAGWVVTLAGPEGKALENRFNTELAAMMIYDASDPGYKINPARFYDTNEAALEDMRKLAEK
jgi:hypothetical protein